MAPRGLSMMSSSVAISQCGRRRQVAPPAGASAPTSPTTGCSTGSMLAPGPDRDVRLLAADRDVRVGRVRDPEEELLDLGLDGRELGVDRLDLAAGLDRRRLQRGDLRAVGPGAALDRLADLLARRVALGLEGVALAEERPAARVELEGAVDDRRVLALVDGALAGSCRRPRAAAAARRSCRHLPRGRSGLAKPVDARTPDRGRPAASRRAARSVRPRNAA